jgi:poly(A) polymerase
MSLPSPRDVAAGIAADLQAAGHTAVFAGGCVRDELLQLEPSDYDVATSATPEEVIKVFPRALPVGIAFGVMLVRRDGLTTEVATFRSEGLYSDHRRPDEVQFTDDVHDANRRDFTINGLFQDPVTGEIIDHVGGKADLKAGVLRAIGDPAARFNEDHLRMLRAVRFVASLGVELDPGTEQAIMQHAPELTGVSRDRIGDEVRRILLAPGGVAGIELLERTGLGSAIFGTPAASGTLARLTQVHSAEVAVPSLLAAWAMDRGGEAYDIAATVGDWRECLQLSNEQRDGMGACLSTHERLLGWSSLGVAARKRLAASPWAESAIEIVRASDEPLATLIRADVVELARTGLNPPRLLDGDILLDDGMPGGAAFGQVLESVYDAQLEGRVTSVDEAIQLARELSGR